MKHRVTEFDVISIPVPPSTDTYVAVPNSMIINMVRECLHGSNFIVDDVIYRTNGTSTQMSALYKLKTPDNELSQMLGFYNSYDKTRPFGIGGGTFVNICLNGMIAAEFKAMRKHTGNIKGELQRMIESAVNDVTPNFERASKEKKYFQNQPIEDISVIHELVGEMFMTENLLQTTQITELRRQLSSEKNTFRMIDNASLLPNANAWQFYNSCTEVFKSELPINFVDKHIDFHNFMKNKFVDEPRLSTSYESVVPEVL
jgi:hypothetical protein